MIRFEKRNIPMYSWNLEKERLDAEAYLTGPRNDFVTTYMTVANLQFIIKEHTDIISKNTAAALLAVLKGTEHASQKQVFFLYKKAADGLGEMIAATRDQTLAETAKNALIHILTAYTDKPCRAAAEALGSVPLTVTGPRMPEHPGPDMPRISWDILLETSGFSADSSLQWKGRNVLVSASNHSRVLVLKMARRGEDPAGLADEGLWMDFLKDYSTGFLDDAEPSDPACLFQIPRPIRISGHHVFQIDDFPLAPSQKNSENPAVIDPRAYAVGFTAPMDYFCYPNETESCPPLMGAAFLEIMGRNAWLLGRLTSTGIVHTAPIPLFHNRVQRERRPDRGLYEWPRAGRLDRWLSSCRFPNIGKTGIRDFEHFISFSGSSRKLYQYIGSHVLSLVLVAGSYFRNLEAGLVGLDDNDQPVDARHLFDAGLFAETVRSIFLNYYKGFTGTDFCGPLPFDLDAFVSRLIDEMGVDRYMEEILRVTEQNAMTNAAFVDFLADRGFSEKQIEKYEKGRADIPILTGPHLGGFNQAISVPELIEFTGATSALCVADRYFRMKFSGGQ